MGEPAPTVQIPRQLLVEGIGVVIAGALILLGTAVADESFGTLVGIGLVVVAAADGIRLWRTHTIASQWLRPVVTAVAGAVLALVRPEDQTDLATIIAIGLVIAGLVAIFNGVRLRQDRWNRIVIGLIELAAAALIALFPQAVLRTATAAFGLGLVAVGLVTVGMALSGRASEGTPPLRAFAAWVQERQYSIEERAGLVRQLYFVGEDATTRLTRFATLLGLATIIATLGVAADNVAVVIGAMLISPITTPIMGISAGIVMAFPRRTTLSLVTLLIAGVAVVAVGALIGVVLPGFVLDRNGLVSSFATPTLIDLGVALAAGAAGGFATARRDVANSLPGVAVSLTLVPALATAGLLFEESAFSLGFGALLNFVTNAVAIVFAAAVAFVLTGFAPFQRLRETSRRLPVGIGVVVLVILLISIPLAWTVQQIIEGNNLTTGIEADTREWLGENANYEVLEITLLTEGEEGVEIRIAGTGPLPPLERLESTVQDRVARDIDLIVKVIEQRVLERGEASG